jgi:hypothetical protein
LLKAARRDCSGQEQRSAPCAINAIRSIWIFLCVPGYFLLQAALTFWTSGGWRKATLAPAVIMAPILAYTVLAFAAQSNLWPLLLILSAPLACLYLVILGMILLLRHLVRPA